MNKHLLLITFLFLITPQAKADMDYYCDLTPNKYNVTEMRSLEIAILKADCKRNNIIVFQLKPDPDDFISPAYAETVRSYAILRFCRYDRNVITDPETGITTCVLYSQRGRIQSN